MKSSKKRKKVFSMFKLLSAAMAVTIILTGCTGTPGADGRDGVDGRDGKDGKTPTITINSDGYWVINGEVTTYKAVGSDGKNGVNGKDGKDGVDGKDGKDGKDGETPTITINKDGYWVINGEVTNIKAKGNDGKPGADGKDGKDGEDGQNGEIPTIEINEEGYWVINGVVTEYKAVVDGGSNDDNDSSETEPIVMEGDGQTFHRFAPSTLSFRSTAPLDEFQEVQVNGETVDPSNYTLTEGSTIVTFNTDYLQSLSTTNHEVTVVSDSLSASANFEVIEPETNEHGFYYNQPYSKVIVEPFIVQGVPFYNTYNYHIYVFNYGGTGVYSTSSGSQIHTQIDSYADSNFTYSVTNDIITLNFEDRTETININNNELYSNKLNETLIIDNDIVCADQNYYYFKVNNRYSIKPINYNQTHYPASKNNINGFLVDAVGSNAFVGTNLESIELANSIQYIGHHAFQGTNLNSVFLPDGILTIYHNSFESTLLEKIVLPNSLHQILPYAFSNCENLTEIIFEGTVAEWELIEKKEYWNENVPATEVVCSDGVVPLN